MYKNSEGKRAHVDFKTETKGDDIKEVIEDKAIRTTYVQNKALKGHTSKL